MPRNGSEVYSAPVGTTATSGTTIESAKYNAFVADLTALANEARPVSAGGTGQTSIGAIRTSFKIAPYDASATISGDWTFTGTVDLTGATVTGVTPADGSITTAKLDDGAVTTAKIGADAVDGTKIADDSINSEHYADGSIDTAHIANDAVTADKLANTAVTAGSYTAADITVDAQGRVTAASSGSTGGWEKISLTAIPSSTNTLTITGLGSYRSIRWNLDGEPTGTGTFIVEASDGGSNWRTIGSFTGVIIDNDSVHCHGEILNFNDTDGDGRMSGRISVGRVDGVLSESATETIADSNLQTAAFVSYRAENWDQIRFRVDGPNWAGNGNVLVEGMA